MIQGKDRQQLRAARLIKLLLDLWSDNLISTSIRASEKAVEVELMGEWNIIFPTSSVSKIADQLVYISRDNSFNIY